jgi:drug/metabolite transporter (DMT)-like permease
LVDRSKLEFAGGVVLIFLGIVFVFGFGIHIQDLITDAVFVLFGALLILNAYNKSTKEYAPNSRQRQQTRRSGEKSEKKPS